MKIAVVGTGYVGLVTGACFAEMGNHVVCVDNDPEKLAKLQNSEIPIFEPGLDAFFHRNIAKKRLLFTDDLKQAALDSEIVFLCLPTPQGEDGSADLKYVMGVADDLGKIFKESGDEDFKIVVNKSTVPVGTSQKVREILSNHGLTNFEVVSNPEFLREGFAVDDFMKPDRIVVGGKDKRALERMDDLYKPFVRQGNPVIYMDNESAEVTKYAANSYLATRITFMNELANFCERVGADVSVVRKGMGADNRIGKRFLFPGIGYGGSCFPKDVNALIKTGADSGYNLGILETVDKINKRQKLVLVDKLLDYFGGDVKGKRFAIWGLSFKPNTDDMREAPSISIVEKLLELGAEVVAYDPAAMEVAKRYHFQDRIEYAMDEYSALDGADALLTLTEWNEFRNPNFGELETRLKNKIVFDGRNIFEPTAMEERGFVYYSIGRKTVGK